MKRTRSMVVGFVVVVAVAALAACGSSKSSDASKVSAGATTTTVAQGASSGGAYGGGYSGGGLPTTTSAPAAAGTMTVNVAKTKLGTILVDAKGMTLYVFDGDKTMGKSSCNGPCAQAWPPLAPPAGTAAYGGGLSASMFSVITRDDGSKQLAVNGHPLYLWVPDKKAGDTTGQGVSGFYVVGTDGKKIAIG